MYIIAKLKEIWAAGPAFRKKVKALLAVKTPLIQIYSPCMLRQSL